MYSSKKTQMFSLKHAKLSYGFGGLLKNIYGLKGILK